MVTRCRPFASLCLGFLAAGCFETSGTHPSNVKEVTPWVAASSIARSRNPYAWVGDEHNRLMDVVTRELRISRMKSRPRAEKCRWLANLILSELRSDRAPEAVRSYWRGRLFDAASFEESSRALGCKAADEPSAVSPPVFSVRSQPGLPHTEETWDTVDYEPSQEALALADQIENGVYSTSTVSEYDGVLSSVQTEATGLWDGEVILVSSSISASSAFYWQGYLGGATGGTWATECQPQAQCEWQTVGPQGVVADTTSAHATAKAIILADVAGALGAWITNGFSWKMAYRLAARIFISGGAGFAVVALASAAVASGAVAAM